MTTENMASMNEQPSKPRRRWLRFSLRFMLLLVVVMAIPLGWKVNRARNQRIVVAELQKMNAQIIYDYEIDSTKGGRVYRDVPPPGPKWLIDFLGKDYFVEVCQVAVGGPQVTDETIALIARLPKIEHVTIDSDRITDGGLVHFGGMQNLEMVALYSDHLTGAGLVHLRRLRRFKMLNVMGWATDTSLEHVSELSDLEFLQIVGIAHITDIGLAQIAKLRNLRYLLLVGGGPDPNHAGQLTQAGIDKLQKALPNCQIKWLPYD